MTLKDCRSWNLCEECKLLTALLYFSPADFGMSDGTDVKGKCTLVLDRTIIHGHPVKTGNVVAVVKEVSDPTLMCPESDEEVCVGGFYQWPMYKLFTV